MKTLFTLGLSLIFFCHTYSQTRPAITYGVPTEEEIKMTRYEKDTTAKAVMLHETGFFNYNQRGQRLTLEKHIYKKLKVFDATALDSIVETIPLLESSEYTEAISAFRGYVYNGDEKIRISLKNATRSYVEGIGSAVNIVIPDIQDGSIIEYAYKIDSPFLFNFRGWNFQQTIPVLYSELTTKIPVGFVFNKALYGSESFYIHEADWDGNCIQTVTNSMTIRCPIELFAMKDIPAFKVEDFMLSPKNHLARIEFEPKKVIASGGLNRFHHFSSDWKTIDKRYKKDELFGKRLRNHKHFKKNIPDSILRIENTLSRAKAVYYLIQSHYDWNGYFYSYGSTLEDVYDKKQGSAAEINVSLINALQVAGLDAKLMMISTRENGLPTTLHPIFTKFNYTVVHLQIDDKVYLLDATEKEAPFGLLPFYALNVQGRVMDFKKKSSWQPLTPYTNNVYYSKSTFVVQPDGSFKGKSNYSSSGYIALERRKNLKKLGETEYIQEVADNIKDAGTVTNHIITKTTDVESPYEEEYQFTFNPEAHNSKLFLKSFPIIHYIGTNPFTSEERKYPIDIGYPFSIIYQNTIDLGGYYEIVELPESVVINLPGNDGQCVIAYTLNDSVLDISFHFRLNEYRFQPNTYSSLSHFFEYAIDVIAQAFIEIKRAD